MSAPPSAATAARFSAPWLYNRLMSPTLPVSSDPLTPLAFFERTVRVFPEKTAVVYGSQRFSWREFAEYVGRFAGALIRAGIEPGDRVAFLTPNVPALLAALFAVLQVRGVLVTIRFDSGLCGCIGRGISTGRSSKGR